MAGKTKFPKALYVVREKDGDDVYFLACTDINDIDESRVAVYHFVEERELVVSRELVKP